MKTAIDIVLLPSAEMAAKAVQINRALLARGGDKAITFSESCLPHISLCMGIVEDTDLPAIQKIVYRLAADVVAFELTAEHMMIYNTADGRKLSGLSIENNDELQTWHASIMRELRPYLSYDSVNAQMFYNPHEINDLTYTWIKSYAKKHENPSLFHPHITLGWGETAAYKDEFPLAFTALAVAVCQLGNYCTVQKVLNRVNLAPVRIR